MKCIKLLCFLALFVQATATEYNPWFTPPFAFQGGVSTFYTHQERIESPLGDFRAPNNISSIHFDLGLTPWPYWNAEIELFLTDSHLIPFSYEAALFTLRYAWVDTLSTTFISGVTLSFPGKRYLYDYSFLYHGLINTEFFMTVGKGFLNTNLNIWTLAGFGVAERGSPWIHGLGSLEYQVFPSLQWGLFSEAFFGLGSNNIIPYAPFQGYASIDHRSVDIGSYLDYEIHYVGTLSLLGWYTLYAHNWPIQNWGVSLSLSILFSIF